MFRFLLFILFNLLLGTSLIAQELLSKSSFHENTAVSFHLVNENSGAGSQVSYFKEEALLTKGDFEWIGIIEHPQATHPTVRYGFLFKLKPRAKRVFNSMANDTTDIVLRSRGHTFNTMTFTCEVDGLIFWGIYNEYVVNRWFNHIVGKELLPEHLKPDF